MRRVGAALVLLLALASAGCGGDERSDFRRDYRPIDAGVRDLGNAIGSALNGAGDKTNGQIAARFAALSTRARNLANQLDDTDPPANLRPARGSYSRALRKLARDLRALSDAASAGDGSAADRATRAIEGDATPVRSARAALSSALGR
jgi:hypothetical protein